MRKIVIKGLHPVSGNWVILALQDLDEDDGTDEQIQNKIKKLKKMIEDTSLVHPNEGTYVTLSEDKKFMTFDPRKFLALEVKLENYIKIETIR